MKIIIDVMMWIVWKPFRKLMVNIPFPLMHLILKSAAFVFYLTDKKRREGVADEIRMISGSRLNEDQIKKKTKETFYFFLRKVYENLLYGHITEKHFDRFAYFDGIQNLENALSKNKGAILLSLHFGSFFLYLLGLGLKGYKTNAITGTPLLEGSSYIKNKLFELRKKEENTYPFKIVSVANFLGPLVRALKRNEIIGLVIDGREGTSLIPARFLGKTAQFSHAIINFCIRTGAAILPCLAVRGADKKHKLIFMPQLEFTVTQDKEETLRINLEKLIEIFEKYVYEYPELYAMTLYGIKQETKKGLIPPLFLD